MEIKIGHYYQYVGKDFPSEEVLCTKSYTWGTERIVKVLRSNGDAWAVFAKDLEAIKEKSKPSDMLLPTDAQERKQIPIVSGVLDYFPLAIAEVAKCSKAGNDQHHPGEPLFWDKTKSTDHADCIGRHLIDRGKFDTDGQRHSAKLAWRALALLQLELEEETKKGN